MKRFILVDCNNFFVSCERVFNPSLYYKPVVVLSSGDACIISRSNEAKALGIAMGMPAYKYKDLFAQHNVLVYSANFALYGDMSRRIMQTLSEFAAEMEIYSVDEAFLHVSEYNFPIQYSNKYYYIGYGHHLKTIINQRIGIPISIGIGSTKTLAKVAIEFAKKVPAYDGVFDIEVHADKNEFLKKIEVKDIWGVGWRFAKKLQKIGAQTAYDFMQLDDTWIRKNMSINGLKTAHELRGIVCFDLQENAQESRDSICVSRLFGHKLDALGPIKEALATYVSTAARKLRNQQSVARMLSVFLVTNKYHDPYNFFWSTECELSMPTAYTPTLIQAAQACLDRIYKPGFLYKKVGVILYDLVPSDCLQLNTYEQPPHIDKQNKVMKTIDVMNSRWGRERVFFAAAGTERQWMMKQSKKSPCFTTNWHELYTIEV
jgi:DNA polymerase V